MLQYGIYGIEVYIVRMRKKPWSKKVYKETQDYWMEVNDKFRGKWKSLLGVETLHLEIGAGKGDYWHGLSELYPNRGVIALERDYTAGSFALRKLNDNNNLKNKKWILGDAEDLMEIFSPHEIDVIHLNFSDPWPKKKHNKRRLTYPDKLDKYYEVLSENGEIWFKTDNRLLFNDSVIYFDQHHFDLIEFDVDFRSEQQIDPITEYEQKFMDKDMPIYRAVWRKKNVK